MKSKVVFFFPSSNTTHHLTSQTAKLKNKYSSKNPKTTRQDQIKRLTKDSLSCGSQKWMQANSFITFQNAKARLLVHMYL